MYNMFETALTKSFRYRFFRKKKNYTFLTFIQIGHSWNLVTEICGIWFRKEISHFKPILLVLRCILRKKMVEWKEGSIPMVAEVVCIVFILK